MLWVTPKPTVTQSVHVVCVLLLQYDRLPYQTQNRRLSASRTSHAITHATSGVFRKLPQLSHKAVVISH